MGAKAPRARRGRPRSSAARGRSGAGRGRWPRRRRRGEVGGHAGGVVDLGAGDAAAAHGARGELHRHADVAGAEDLGDRVEGDRARAGELPGAAGSVARPAARRSRTSATSRASTIAIGACPNGAASVPLAATVGATVSSRFCMKNDGRRNAKSSPERSMRCSLRQCATAVGVVPFGPSVGAPPEIFTIRCTPAATAASSAAASRSSWSGPCGGEQQQPLDAVEGRRAASPATLQVGVHRGQRQVRVGVGGRAPAPRRRARRGPRRRGGRRGPSLRGRRSCRHLDRAGGAIRRQARAPARTSSAAAAGEHEAVGRSSAQVRPWRSSQALVGAGIDDRQARAPRSSARERSSIGHRRPARAAAGRRGGRSGGTASRPCGARRAAPGVVGEGAGAVGRQRLDVLGQQPLQPASRRSRSGTRRGRGRRAGASPARTAPMQRSPAAASRRRAGAARCS